MTDTTPSGRRERKRAQTLNHLAATAFALFEEHGFDAVTMEQIAAAADVAKGTLYNHFPVKEALLGHQFHAEFDQGMVDLRDRVAAQPDLRGRLRVVLTASAQWCRARRPYLMPYFRYRFTSEDSQRSNSQNAYGALIAAAQQAGEVRRDLDSDHLALLFKQLYFGAVWRWLTLAERDLDAEFAAILDLFLDGARIAGDRP